MGNYYSDPTANKALGNVQREYCYRWAIARELERKRRAGRLTSRDVDLARRLFVGIFRNLPTLALSRVLAK